MRPSFDDIFIDFAVAVSKRSTCSRASVGCVIASFDNTRVLALGYNGSAKGLNNDCQSLTPGQCGHIHAEVNALIKLDYSPHISKTAYVTMSPCYNCSIAIINAGVDRVVYLVQYRDISGLELLRQAGILTEQYEKKEEEKES